MMAFAVTGIVQFSPSILYLKDEARDWLLLFNNLRASTLYTAIGIQIFEWFNTYLQIMFQDQEHVDITTVVV